MKILITGGSGFIGKPVIQKLKEKGHIILALSRSASKLNNKEEIENIRWINSSLNLSLETISLLKDFKPEIVIHLAWEKIPDFSFETSFENLNNHILFFNCICKISSVKKILVAGSCFEYNQKFGECQETDNCISNNYFTWAKNTLRDFLQFECLQNKISLVWLRIFYVYGPNQRSGSLIPGIIKNLVDDKMPELKKPANANDFIYVDDVAEAFVKMTEQDINGGIYNLGSGTSTSVIEILRLIEGITHGNEKITDYILTNTANSATEIDFWANMEKTNKNLDWHSSTSLKEGIKNMINSIQGE